MSEQTVHDPIYRVVEVGVDGVLQPKIVAAYDSSPFHGHRVVEYNKRTRIYPLLRMARMYRNRLAKEGREARIMKFTFEGFVE